MSSWPILLYCSLNKDELSVLPCQSFDAHTHVLSSSGTVFTFRVLREGGAGWLRSWSVEHVKKILVCFLQFFHSRAWVKGGGGRVGGIAKTQVEKSKRQNVSQAPRVSRPTYFRSTRNSILLKRSIVFYCSIEFLIRPVWAKVLDNDVFWILNSEI